ncbi:MAG: hypothetical protein OHK0053_32050 [Microscillaceae bacterium]
MKSLTLLGSFCVLLALGACENIEEIAFIEFRAEFSAPLVVRQGELVQFRPGLGTTGSQSYRWYFGDAENSTAQGVAPNFAYDSIGMFVVKLVVEINKTNGLQKDSLQRPIFVLPNLETTASPNQVFGLPETDERGYAFTTLQATGFALAGQSAIRGLWLAKTNADLSLAEGWPRIYQNFGTSTIQARAIHETLDGGLLVAGFFQYTANDNEAFLLKTDAQGNEQWRRIINSDKEERYVAIIENPVTGELVIVGTVFTSGRPAITLDRYTAAGQLIQPIALPREVCNSCLAETARRTNDGGLVIGGMQVDRPLILKLGPTLNFEGRSILNTFAGRGLGVAQLRDGRYALIGEARPGASDSTNAFVAKFDIIGNVAAWQQRIVLYQEALFDIWQEEADPEQDLRLVGTHRSPLSGEDVLLVRVGNRVGDVKEVRLLGGIENSNARQAIPSPEGNFTLIGTTDDGAALQRNILLWGIEAGFWQD